MNKSPFVYAGRASCCDYSAILLNLFRTGVFMNILHLKYATEIEKTGSINKAAENLYIGQPNLSRAIKDLEASLGISVFKRSSKGMVPTAEGKEFLNYAKKILAQIDEVEEIYRSGRKLKQKFSVSVPRASYVTEAFAQFSNKIDKNIPIEMFYMETNAMSTIKNVTDSDYNLGVIRYAVNYDSRFRSLLDEKNLVHELITDFSYVLVMNRNHPLADKEEIKYSDLAPYTELAHGDPFIPSLSSSSVMKEEMPDDISKRIFVFERGSQFELLTANDDIFMWVSPIPQPVLDRYGLVQKVCIDNKRKYRDVLIYKKEYRLSELDNIFITELIRAKRKYM